MVTLNNLDTLFLHYNRLVDDGRNGRHVESENNSGSFNYLC